MEARPTNQPLPLVANRALPDLLIGGLPPRKEGTATEQHNAHSEADAETPASVKPTVVASMADHVPVADACDDADGGAGAVQHNVNGT